MERTCKRCGTQWYVGKKAAKERKPGRLEMFGANSRAVGDRLSGSGKRGAGELQLMNLQARAQRVEANNSCPNCGSGSFNERKVKM
jgi:ribosomal protein S27AE